MTNIVYILTIFSIIALLLGGKKQFTESYTGLTRKQNIWLGIIAACTVTPVIIFIAYVLYIAYVLNPSDHWYRQTQEHTAYHIYRSSFPPSGKIQTSLYMPTTIAGYSNGIRIIYDQNIYRPRPQGATGAIIVNEVGVPPTFDMASFIRTTSGMFTRRRVDVTTSFDLQGTLLEQEASGAARMGLKQLIFRTPDNVLIHISGMDTTDANLIQVANTLK